jgi:hypothetical protein
MKSVVQASITRAFICLKSTRFKNHSICLYVARQRASRILNVYTIQRWLVSFTARKPYRQGQSAPVSTGYETEWAQDLYMDKRIRAPAKNHTGHTDISLSIMLWQDAWKPEQFIAG